MLKELVANWPAIRLIEDYGGRQMIDGEPEF